MEKLLKIALSEAHKSVVRYEVIKCHNLHLATRLIPVKGKGNECAENVTLKPSLISIDGFVLDVFQKGKKCHLFHIRSEFAHSCYY